MITACEKNFFRVINCSGALLNVKYTSINISQATFSIKSLPKFSVRVGVPDLVHLVDHVNHRVDV